MNKQYETNQVIALFALLVAVAWCFGLVVLICFLGMTLDSGDPVSKAALIGDASNAITGLISSVALVFVIVQIFQNNKMILDNQNALKDQLDEQIESKEQFARLATAQEEANKIDLRKNVGSYIKTFVDNEKSFLEANTSMANYHIARKEPVEAQAYSNLTRITQIRLSKFMELYQKQDTLDFSNAVNDVSKIISSYQYP